MVDGDWRGYKFLYGVVKKYALFGSRLKIDRGRDDFLFVGRILRQITAQTSPTVGQEMRLEGNLFVQKICYGKTDGRIV